MLKKLVLLNITGEDIGTFLCESNYGTPDRCIFRGSLFLYHSYKDVEDTRFIYYKEIRIKHFMIEGIPQIIAILG